MLDLEFREIERNTDESLDFYEIVYTNEYYKMSVQGTFGYITFDVAPQKECLGIKVLFTTASDYQILINSEELTFISIADIDRTIKALNIAKESCIEIKKVIENLDIDWLLKGKQMEMPEQESAVETD